MPPRSLQIDLDLTLPSIRPSRVIFLGYLHALVAKQDCDTLDRDACKQQFGGKRIPESVPVPIGYLRKPEKSSQSPLPTANNTVQSARAVPEEMSRRHTWNSVKRPNHKIRGHCVNRDASFLRVKEQLIPIDFVTCQRGGSAGLLL
jgi:hypothetical protein